MGLSFIEMDDMTEGEVWDMLAELANDQYDYPLKAGQEQFNEFVSG